MGCAKNLQVLKLFKKKCFFIEENIYHKWAVNKTWIGLLGLDQTPDRIGSDYGSD